MSMTADIIIRPTIKDDLPAIKDILNDIIANYDYYLSDRQKTFEDIEQWFDDHQNNDRYFILSAFSGEDFAGWISLSPFRSSNGYNITAELSVYVHPNFYRKGIASALMWEMEGIARQRGMLHCIMSVITANNISSIKLHEKHGFKQEGYFKEIGSKNGYYKDVVFMTKLI